MPTDEFGEASEAGEAGEGDGGQLAAVVAKQEGDAAIERLRAEGVYDATRTVREFDADTIAVPVTDPPGTDVLRVVRQPGARRLRDLEDHLRERGWTDREIDRAPASWAVLGTVILVDIDGAPRPGELGEALLDLHGGADTVLARHGIAGDHLDRGFAVGAGDTAPREDGVGPAVQVQQRLA